MTTECAAASGDLPETIDEIASTTGFSGVVRVDRGEQTEFAAAYGLADRAHGIPNTLQTRFAIASGTKGLTALVVMSLIEGGRLALDTPARDLLGDDLRLIPDDVTIEHLLAHRSGIGDYLDEDELTGITDYVMPVPVHRLASTADYLVVLDGHESAFPAGSAFSYNNSGYVVLALLAERATGASFADLVRDLVTTPAGMSATAFLRSDELPGEAARGYLSATGLRTNVLHLPVLGSGDGGVYSTAADVSAFWRALFAGRIVAPATVAEMIRPRSDWPQEQRRYGLGFHLRERGDGVFLEGYDAGVSFAGVHAPTAGLTYTVIANWSDGAWPVIRAVRELLGDGSRG